MGPEISLIIVLGGVLVVLALLALRGSFFTVRQQTVSVIERFGRYVRAAQPGLNSKLPVVDKVAGALSLRIQQLDVEVETKTADDVFVRVMIAVQY